MKHLLWLLLATSLAVRAAGQSNAPVRVAVIAESAEASAASDLLTAELSKNSRVTLLERNEIDRVYREQGFSAENRNYVKLGQVLGADGLCLLEITRTATQTNLSMRVVAVKPGVILANENFTWPVENLAAWAPSAGAHLKPLLPKLGVLVKEAIPLSVVNIRSALASKDATEMEQQLKLLTIQRLSHEPQFFVLEREKMQLLGDEKSLKGLDDSPFWNGSYLLEGVLDQSGYSKTTLTINARLTPAKGGAPLLFEIKGNRTNLAEIVNLIALKISELLKANSTVADWNADDEAAQYFAEANWALKWGVLSEAQMASDSTWALGKQDLDCAAARMKAYLPEVTSGMYDFVDGSYTISEGMYLASAIRYATNELSQQYAAFTFNFHEPTLDYVALAKPPAPEFIDRAIKTLALYEDLSHALADQLQSTNNTTVAATGKWHELGVADLTAAAKVLQRFQFVPGSEKPVAEKLTELRAEARAVDKLISDIFPTKKQYFIGDKLTSYDSLSREINNSRNILTCEVQWGCFWQETPEDCLTLYRELLKSPAFCMFHDGFWIREPEQPRLAAWNERDRNRIPELWTRFVQNLNQSTNLTWQMEAQALAFADATDKTGRDTAFTNLFNFVSEHREELRSNPFRLFSNRWGLDELFVNHGSYYKLYEANLQPLLSGIDMDYQTKTIPEAAETALLPEQKKYLEANTPIAHSNYFRLFFAKKYSKAQALELQPLASAYKSNLVVQSQVSRETWDKLGPAMTDAFSLVYDLNHTIDPSLPRTASWEGRPGPPGARAKIASSADHATTSNSIQRPISSTVQSPEVIQKPPRVALASNSVPPSAATNIIVVNKFVELPLDGLPGEHRSLEKITVHQFVEGKLLLDFSYTINDSFPITMPDGSVDYRVMEEASAIAVFDPVSEHLELIPCPLVDRVIRNSFRYRTTLFRGQVYHSEGGKISRYDSKAQKWEVLPISNGINYALFNVADHLYAADGTTIFEIVDSGKSTRLLCSTRRNPPVTLLDSQNLGTPILMEGPNHSLRVIGKDKIFSLVNNDWVEEGPAPQRSWTPQILPEGVLFRHDPDGSSQPDSLSYLTTDTKSPELLLLQKAPLPRVIGSTPDYYKRINAESVQSPLWAKPKGLALAKLPAAMDRSDLYLLADNSTTQDIANDQHVIQLHQVLPKGDHQTALLHFSRDLAEPQTVFLRFDSTDGAPPATGIDPRTRPMFSHTPPVWMLFSRQFLIVGVEKAEGFDPDTQNLGYGYKTGFWLLPLSQLEREIATQKQFQIAQSSAANAAGQKGKQTLLAKYDKDHNGVIEGEEKEEAFGDWNFLESQLNVIDVNQNHRLDVTELVYFDANQNGILETNEESAIYAVQELLAAKLLEEVDRDENGEIDQFEFFSMVGRADLAGFHAFQKVQAKSEAERLEIYLRNSLKESINPYAYDNSRRHTPGIPLPVLTTFKEKVEDYWAWLKTHSTAQKP